MGEGMELRFIEIYILREILGVFLIYFLRFGKYYYVYFIDE